MNLMILIALFMSGSAMAQGSGKIVGQLGMVEGQVFMDQRPVSRNIPIREGSIIEVKAGKATLLLGTGSVFHLAANSKMTVTQFGIRNDSKKEGGDVSLHFGRTRALIMNKGNETKDVRIITRMATMGVRGTEVFVDVPEDVSKPVQFFTLEGLAKVEMEKSPPVDVKQNQGVSTAQSDAQGEVQATPPRKTLSEVKQEIREGGLQVATVKTPEQMNRSLGEFQRDPPPAIPFPRFDPIQDRVVPLKIQTRFCNATTGNCS
jgi:hypothetical protein